MSNTTEERIAWFCLHRKTLLLHNIHQFKKAKVINCNITKCLSIKRKCVFWVEFLSKIKQNAIASDNRSTCIQLNVMTIYNI